MRFARRFRPALLLAAIKLLFCMPTHAALLPTYDLDTLIHLSSDIVDGVVLDSPPSGPPLAVRYLHVRVTHTYAGQVRTGQVLSVAEIDCLIMEQQDDPTVIHMRRKNGVWTPDPSSQIVHRHTTFLGAGTHVTLFLKSDDEAPGKFAAVLSGVKVENRGRVNGFAQLMDPGPYVRIDHLEANATDPPPTPAKFRAMVAARLKAVRAMRPSPNRAATSASHIERASPSASPKHASYQPEGR